MLYAAGTAVTAACDRALLLAPELLPVLDYRAFVSAGSLPFAPEFAT